jgi:hypothetical protein
VIPVNRSLRISGIKHWQRSDPFLELNPVPRMLVARVGAVHRSTDPAWLRRVLEWRYTADTIRGLARRRLDELEWGAQ